MNKAQELLGILEDTPVIIDDTPEKISNHKKIFKSYGVQAGKAEKELDILLRSNSFAVQKTLDEKNSKLLFRAKELLETIKDNAISFANAVDKKTGDSTVKKLPTFKV